MHRTNQPAEADIGHEVLDGGIGLNHSGLVVKGHREPSGELDQEAHQGDAAEAVKNVYVGRHVLGRDVVGDRLDLETLVKPVVNGVRFGVGSGRGGVRHAAGGFGCESLPTVLTPL